MVSSTTHHGQTNSQISTLVNKTVNALLVNFPAWKNSVPDDPQQFLNSYRQELVRAMQEMGVNSDSMISRGMKKARASGKPFLPSPGEFCEWCKPTAEDYGLPSIEEAFKHSRGESGKSPAIRRWKHQACYLASAATGFFELKSLSDSDKNYRETKARFTDEYNKLVERVISGEVLEVPPEQRLEQPKPWGNKQKAKEAGEQALNNLKGVFDE